MKGSFNEIINGDMPVLIDFHALWCGPCKMQAPILKEVASEWKGKVRVIKIDIDQNPALTQRYQITGVPTLAIFKKGQMVWRQSGMQSKHQLNLVLSTFTSESVDSV